MRQRRMLPGSLFALLGGIALAGCGGYDKSVFDNPGDGTDATGTDTIGIDTTPNPDAIGTDSIVPPTDGPGVDTPPAGITLDNVCAKLAEVVCASPLETCCASKGFKFSGSACMAGISADCSLDVAAVKAGTMKFDATKYGKCADAWTAMLTKCSVPALEFIKMDAVCDELFSGMIPPGGACTRDTQCAAPVGALGSCSDTNRCQVFSVGGKDAPCNYTGDVQRFCDVGFYCSSTGTAPGTCKAAKPTGGSCGGTWDSSCGWGNSCVTYRCAPGLAMGDYCYDALQCASWDCVSNKCTDPNEQLASAAFCGG